MGTKNNPGAFDCYEAADPNEPMFVLLARDPNAPGLVQTWCSIRIARIVSGASPESDMAKVREAQACAIAMEEWRKANR